MNRSNGPRFQQRGPFPGRGPGMPDGRGMPFPPPNHSAGRQPPGFADGRIVPPGRGGMMGRPPPNPPMMMMGGGGGRIPPHMPPPGGQFPNVCGVAPPLPFVPHNGNGMMAMNRPQQPPPPPIIPPPPPHMRPQIPTMGRPIQRMHQHQHGNMGPMFPTNPGRGINQMVRPPPPLPPIPLPIQQQQQKQQQYHYPPNINSSFNNKQIPPPPPMPYAQQPYNQHGLRPPFNPTAPHNAITAPPPTMHGNGIHQYNSSMPNTNLQQQQQQQQSSIMNNPLATAHTTHSKEQIDAAWTEHVAPNGTVYYHNSLLKTSTYDKPEVLKNKEIPKTTTTTTSSEHPWKQYTDAATGKLYYSNGIVTTWEKPEGFTKVDETKETPVAEPPKKKKKPEPNGIQLKNKEEAIALFKGLLLEKEILPAAKWNDVSKLLSPEAKWIACEDFLTTGERKQALAEYQTKRANDLRDQERKEKIRIKEAFMQLLTEKVSEMKGFSAFTSTIDDIKDVLAKDSRYHAVEQHPTRESLFLDFCEEYRKREERRKRAMKREAQEAFEEYLREQEESGLLTYTSTWNTFTSSLDGKLRSDQRFDSSVLTDSDRQLYFADFMLKIQKLEDERRIAQRSEQIRVDKAQREALLDDLRMLSESGKIRPDSTWRSIDHLVSTLSSFEEIQAEGRQDPRDMFDDFINEWNESYRRDRNFLSRIVYPPSGPALPITPSTTMDEFRKALIDTTTDAPDAYRQLLRILDRNEPVSNVRVFLDELRHEANEEHEKSSFPRRGSAWLRGDDSSEDEEGEIEE